MEDEPYEVDTGPMLDPPDPVVDLMMRAAMIGREYGLDLAHARLDGAVEFPVLSWNYLRDRIEDVERQERQSCPP